MNFSESTQFNNFGGSYSQLSTIDSIYQLKIISEDIGLSSQSLDTFYLKMEFTIDQIERYIKLFTNWRIRQLNSQNRHHDNQFSPKNIRKNINSLNYSIQKLFTTYQGIQHAEAKALHQLSARSAYLNQLFISWLDQNTPTNSNKQIEVEIVEQLPIQSIQEISFSFEKFTIKNDRFQRKKNNIDLGRFKNRDMKKEEQSQNIFKKISQDYELLENNAQALISRIFTYNDQLKLHNTLEEERYRLKWKYIKQKEKYVSKGTHTSQNQKKDFQLYSGIIQDRAGRVKQLLVSFRNRFQDRYQSTHQKSLSRS